MDQAAKISLAEAVIGHMFQNKNLIWEAIQAPGRTNERLALIGDAALRLFHHQQGYRNGLSKGKHLLRFLDVLLWELWNCELNPYLR